MLWFIIFIALVALIGLPIIFFGAVGAGLKGASDLRQRLPEVLAEVFDGRKQAVYQVPTGIQPAEVIEVAAASGYDLVHTITEAYSTTLVFERRSDNDNDNADAGPLEGSKP